ncbi:MAG TPA: HAD family hydrolase [Longimicrobiales bacterium]|nr:HAD family hydrolase [Longimicrobiales bacterium]
MMEQSNVALVLVDFDDTLVDTAPRFQKARRSLFGLLQSIGIDEALAERVHHEHIDRIMLDRHGLGPARLQYSFRATYEHLCTELGLQISAELAEQCAELGRTVAGPPPLIEGALEALRRLSARFPTAIYTQASDREYQLACVAAAGVDAVVGLHRVLVCERKTRDAFESVLAEFEVEDPSTAWMIGNSMRSDINPALEIGARAILVEVDEPWEFDLVDPVSPDYVRVRRFRDAVDYLIG